MNVITKNIIRFFIIVLIQSLVLNQIEPGFGIHFMLQPLFIMLLPFELSVVWMMIIAFVSGFVIDMLANTYGLSACAMVLIAFIRPYIFKMFSPREGYDPLKEPNISDMGTNWFLTVFSLLVAIHHFWYFLIEIFRFSDLLYIFQNVILSGITTILISVLAQTFLIERAKGK